MLEPLVSKRAGSVAAAVLRIFTVIGAPAILQSDNGREFSNLAGKGSLQSFPDEELGEIIEELAAMWPEVKMVKGRARHSESNGGVERLNQTVQRRLSAWMTQSRSRNWGVGARLVQWAINTTFHNAIRMTPYEAVFGQKPRVGISSLPLSKELLASLHDEEELMRALEVRDDDAGAAAETPAEPTAEAETADAGSPDPVHESEAPAPLPARATTGGARGSAAAVHVSGAAQQLCTGSYVGPMDVAQMNAEQRAQWPRQCPRDGCIVNGGLLTIGSGMRCVRCYVVWHDLCSDFEPDGVSVFQCDHCTQAESEAAAHDEQPTACVPPASQKGRGRASKRAREQQPAGSTSAGAAPPATGRCAAIPAARRA